jgi:hypothetical protein
MTNARGHLNAKQRSKTFKVNRARRYFVLVSDGAQPVACAKLKGKKKAKRPCKGGPGHHGKPKPGHHHKPKPGHHGKPKPEHHGKPKGEAPGKPKGAGAAKRGCKRRGR